MRYAEQSWLLQLSHLLSTQFRPFFLESVLTPSCYIWQQWWMSHCGKAVCQWLLLHFSLWIHKILKTTGQCQIWHLCPSQSREWQLSVIGPLQFLNSTASLTKTYNLHNINKLEYYTFNYVAYRSRTSSEATLPNSIIRCVIGMVWLCVSEPSFAPSSRHMSNGIITMIDSHSNSM